MRCGARSGRESGAGELTLVRRMIDWFIVRAACGVFFFLYRDSGDIEGGGNDGDGDGMGWRAA